MYLNNLNKRLKPMLNGRAIKVIQNILNTPYKIYKLNVSDSETEYNDIKIALDDVIEMEVGDDLGMVAHLLPHTYLRSNPFSLETSDRTIVDVDDMVMTAKKKGTATITVKTLNEKYSDSITVNVVEPYEFTATETETYNLDPTLFNLIEYDETKDLDVLDEEAWNNSNAIQFLFLYMNREGYKKVVFPKNKTYLFHPVNSIYCKNNIIVDLNGSTLQEVPHLVTMSTGIFMNDSEKKINICPRGWVNLVKTAMYKFEVSEDSYQYDYETYSYPIPRTGNVEEYYINGEIKVLEKDDTSTEYKNFILKNKVYNGSFKFTKYMKYNIDKTSYTANNINLIAELYKNGSFVKEQVLFTYYWNTYNHYGSKDFSFSIVDDVDKIKIKATGLAEEKGTEIISILSDLKIYALDENFQEFTENIVFENGSILGDRLFKNELKTKIFKEEFNLDWKDIQKTEQTQNIAMNKGRYVGCKNMTIGNSIGFNIMTDSAKRINAYYPNGEIMELGNLGNNGENIEATNYARFSEYVEVDLSKSNRVRIGDPTFSTSYYFKYQSRIIDIYCYNEDKVFIRALKGKFRHGLLSLPVETKYIKIAIPLLIDQGERLITTGNAEYYNCIFAIEIIEPLEKAFLKNCTIENNYSTGIAHMGNNFLIENCTFNNNIGRMPWCDIDCEDGWLKMQNNIFRNNTFNSYWGTIMCAGTNFVFKNNTYNGSFTLYDQCQYFKIINNIFKCPENPNIAIQSDSYVFNNNFKECVQVNVSKQHANSEYKCYYGNNIFEDIKLNNTYNVLYDTGDNKYNFVEIIGDGNTTESIFSNSLKNINGGIKISKPLTISNVSIPNTIIANATPITFDNCIIHNNATFTSANYKVYYNDCTIYNRNLLSDSSSIYNNCSYVDGISEGSLLNGIVKEGLVFNKTNITSYAGQVMQEVKKGENEFNSFTVSCLVNQINNFAFNPLIGCALIQLGNSFTKNTFSSTTINLQSGRFERKATTGNIGDTNYFVATLTYDSVLRVFNYYINNDIVGTVSLSDDATFKKHSDYSDTNALMKTTGQCRANHYYLYNRVLSDEEIQQNISVFSQLIPNAIIYGDVIAESISLNEGDEKQLNVKLSKQPTQDQEVTLNFSRFNVGLDKIKLKFTPNNYNTEQKITIKAHKDLLSNSDKADKITFSTERGYTLKSDLNENNIIGGDPSTINIKVINTIGDSLYSDSSLLEAKIKELYPKICLNFKGSFDWDSFTSTTLNDCVAGDFWINDKMTLRKVIHARIYEPNDIIYYDGEYLNPLHMPKVNSEIEDNYDICIVGGGAGGVACAYSLKDSGLKVCLIEKLDALGGTHLNSVASLIASPMVPFKNNWLRNILESCYDMNKLELDKYSDTEPIGKGSVFDGIWRSSQITYSTSHRGVQFHLSPSYMASKYFTDLQETINIKLRTEFISSSFANGKVTSISVKNLDTEEIYNINANYFVDCSADGVLCRYNKTLDEDFYIGEDPKIRFNETAYADGYEGNHYAINTVEGSFFHGTGKIDGTDKTRPTDYSDVEVFDDVYNKSNGEVHDKFCSGYTVVSTSSGCSIDPKIFIDEGNDVALELAKKKSKYFAKITGRQYIGQKMLGIRESYRIKCDRMMTQRDMEIRPTSESIKEDKIITLSTWWVDLHNAVVHVNNSGLNGIPYGSLIPCAFSNVLIGSRCMGASHIAQASCRLTRCIMSMGWVCGVALKQCVSNNIENVRNVDIGKIQEEIGIYELFNEVDTWQRIGNGEL